MKKILFSLAAVAAMVGCAKDAPIVDNTNNTPEETLAISASIDLSDTRVTIGGEEFTDVKWAQADIVRLVSVAGVNTELQTTESGDTDVRFRGDAEYKADVDTYYAVYPSTTITNGVASFDLTTQDGKAAKAAVLAATTKDAAKGVIDMAFKPINALLHVAVTGAPTIKTAEFLAFDGAQFASGFSYDFAAETVTTSGATTVLTVNSPNAEDFFFSLPADLNMAAGYIVRLTDTNNNVCSKAYNGKTFAKGTTTRVEFEWSQPTVTLGTPMTSYSYYVAGNVSQANNCTNNVIYFPNASTYANVQNAMVTEAGVNVDGTDYTADFANKSFTPANVTVSSWGEHSVKAYIKTKDGKRYESAPQTVHITGLPYDYTFDGELADFRSAGWTTNGSLKDGNMALAGRTKGVVLEVAYRGSLTSDVEEGFVVSPKFEVPTTVRVQPSILRSSYYLYWSGTRTRTGYVGAVANTNTSNTSSISFTCTNGTDNTKYGQDEWLGAFDLTSTTPYISIDADSFTEKCTKTYFFVHEAHFRYAQ